MSKTTKNDGDIARISNRGDVVQKTANLQYHKEIQQNGMTYSIDMIRLKFKMKSPKTVEQTMATIRDKSVYGNDTPYDFNYWQSNRWYDYRHKFTITLKDKNSFYVAFSLNSDDKTKVSEGVIEFNPNKCFGEKVQLINNRVDDETGEITHSAYEGDLLNYFLINLISNHSKYVKLMRYDLAIDIPCKRKQVKLIKDNKHYSLFAPSLNPDTHTEYLGKHQSSGFTKVYNKTKESGLDHDVTRVEITSEHGNDYTKFMSQFPEVYIKGNGTLFPYMELKNTDLVIYELLIDNPRMETYFKRLGRDKQKKLKPYLFQDTGDVRVTVPENVYNELMKYIGQICGLKDIRLK